MEDEWSEEEVIQLISFYEMHSCLYDLSLKQYRNKEKKRSLEVEIATKIGKTSEVPLLTCVSIAVAAKHFAGIQSLPKQLTGWCQNQWNTRLRVRRSIGPVPCPRLKGEHPSTWGYAHGHRKTCWSRSTLTPSATVITFNGTMRDTVSYRYCITYSAFQPGGTFAI